jgi:hypothetical protein
MNGNGKQKTDEPMPAEGADPPDASAPNRESRKLQGKELRKKCPRSSHAQVILGQTQRDPLTLLEESNEAGWRRCCRFGLRA